MNVLRAYVVTLCVATGLSMSGCINVDAPAEPSTAEPSTVELQTVTQALNRAVDDPALVNEVVGRGYDTIEDSFTNARCVREDSSITSTMEDFKDSHSAQAFYGYVGPDFRASVDQNLYNDWTYSSLGQQELYDPSLDDVFGAWDHSEEYNPWVRSDDRILVVGIELETVRRQLVDPGVDPLRDGDVYVCPGEELEIDGDVQAFVALCGDRLLNSVQYGGMIYLMLPMMGLPDDLSQRMETLLDINTAYSSRSIIEAMTNLDQVLQNDFPAHRDLKFEVVAPKDWAQLPAAQNVLSQGRLYPRDTKEYLHTIWDAAKTELQNNMDGSYRDVYGMMLRKQFVSYGSEYMLACGVDLPDEFVCYNEMADYQAMRRLVNGPLVKKYDRTRDLALLAKTQSSRVHFAQVDGKKKPLELYEEAIDLYENCYYREGSELAQTITSCRDTYISGELQELCNSCTLPTQCEYQNVYNTFDSLPSARVDPPTPRPGPNTLLERHAVRNQGVKNMGDVVENLCVLSHVSGHMNEWEDLFHLYLETGLGGPDTGSSDYSYAKSVYENSTWALEVDGGARLGEAICAKRSAFLDTSTSTSWISELNLLLDVLLPTYIPYRDGREVAHVTGMQGNFAGGGEAIWVEQSMGSGPLRARLSAGQDDVAGFASSFGMGNPAGGLAQFSTLQGQRSQLTASTRSTKAKQSREYGCIREVQLAPVNEAFCFLTKLKGEFDGRGEGVKLFRSDTHWHLRVTSGFQSDASLFAPDVGSYLDVGSPCTDGHDVKEVEASARCYLYDQR